MCIVCIGTFTSNRAFNGSIFKWTKNPSSSSHASAAVSAQFKSHCNNDLCFDLMHHQSLTTLDIRKRPFEAPSRVFFACTVVAGMQKIFSKPSLKSEKIDQVESGKKRYIYVYILHKYTVVMDGQTLIRNL